MANGDKGQLDVTAAFNELLRLKVEGAQSGKKSVTEAQNAAVAGYSPGSSWEQVEKSQNLQIYSKNNLFYFGQKGKPSDIEWLEVGDRISVGKDWMYPVYTRTAGGATVKTVRYESKEVTDPTLFKGGTGKRDADKAISERGLLGSHVAEYQPREDGYRIVPIKEPEVDRYPGTFEDMEAVNEFKQENPEWADYEATRDAGTGRILLEKPKAEAAIKDRYPGSFGTEAEAEQAKSAQGLTNYQSIRDPESGLWFLQRTKETAAPGEAFKDETSGQWMIRQPDGSLRPFTPASESEIVEQDGRQFIRDTQGNLRPLSREYQPSITEVGGRTIMQQPTGQISELQRQFDPGVITRDGLQLLQQPGGQISQTRAANINEIIAQALVDGDFDKALAFQDFATRPSAKEAFDAALSFARPPADQQLVSSIARGETPVTPPPPGVVQRIGPQPDFLVQAYNEFQQRLRGGRPPTPEEQSKYAARYRSGETPLSDELQLKMKTQEDANQRQIEKLELQRETAQQNFELKLEKQQQDFQLQLSKLQATSTAIGGDRDSAGIAYNPAAASTATDAAASATTDTTEDTTEAEIDELRRAEMQGYRDILQAPGVGVASQAGLGHYVQERSDRIKRETERIAHERKNVQDNRRRMGANAGPILAQLAADESNLQNVREDIRRVTNAWNDLQRLGGGESPEDRERYLKQVQSNRQAAARVAAQEAKVAAQPAAEEPVVSAAEQAARVAEGKTAVPGLDPNIEYPVKPVPSPETTVKPTVDASGEPTISRQLSTLPSGKQVAGGPTRADFPPTIPVSEAAAPTPAQVVPNAPRGLDLPDMAGLPLSSWYAAQLANTPGATADGPPLLIPPARKWQEGDPLIIPQPGSAIGGHPVSSLAGGGMTHGSNLELVGERGPELVDLAPGSFVLPIRGLNQRQSQRIQQQGNIRGYQSGGIVFQDLPLGLRQQQAGRAITPPRGYLSQAAGLTLPSAQAFQNITPESREVFFDVAKQAGIPQGAFAQELRTAFPGGRRLPVSRMLPLGRWGVR